MVTNIYIAIVFACSGRKGSNSLNPFPSYLHYLITPAPPYFSTYTYCEFHFYKSCFFFFFWSRRFVSLLSINRCKIINTLNYTITIWIFFYFNGRTNGLLCSSFWKLHLIQILKLVPAMKRLETAGQYCLTNVLRSTHKYFSLYLHIFKCFYRLNLYYSKKKSV